MGDDRPNTYLENGTIIYRASSLGNCIRSLVASRLGHEPLPHPDWLLEKFEEGNKNEPVILGMLEDLGWTITDKDAEGQLEVEIPVGSGVKIRGHLDGLGIPPLTATGPDGMHVIEAKAFGQTFWDKYLKEGINAFPYYVMQVSIYMAALGMPCVFVVGLKDAEGKVGKIRSEVFVNPPMNVGMVKAKVAKIEGWVRKGEMPPCDYEQYPCQYYHLHEESENEGPLIEEDLEVDIPLGNYVRAQELEKQAKELKGPAGERLKEILGERAVGSIERTGHVISTQSRTNQKVDVPGLIEKFGREEVNAFIEVTKTQSIRVTAKKEEKGKGEKDA